MLPLVDLKAQYESISEEINAAVQAVLSSGEYVLGQPVLDFERAMATYCGTKHAVGVASGTDALRLALQALGIGPGDDVITTAFTFIASAAAISQCGANPVFVDIDERTFNLDPRKLECVRTKKTKAILVVHLFGLPAPMDELIRFARGHGLFVIEDCAQATGATFEGKKVGSLGDVGCFSFFPTKNLGGYGDGGMVTTNDAAIADRIDLLRRQGSRKKYHSEMLGWNSRLDALQAAILHVKLGFLDGWVVSRRRIAQRYAEELSNLPIDIPHEPAYLKHAFHLYTVRTVLRDALREHLNAHQIQTGIYYPTPLHRQPVYERTHGKTSLPIAERTSNEVISLPLFPELSESQFDQIMSSLRTFFRSKGI